MDLLALVGLDRLLQESQEVRAVAAGFALAEYFTRADIESGEQVRGAVPHIVVCALLGSSEGHGQHRLGAVQRLGE